MKSKDNEDDSENNENNNGNNNGNNGNNNRNNIENINTNPKKVVACSQKEFAKLLTFLAQLHAGNNSKKLENDINRLLKALYKSKQISELVYKNLITAI